MQPQTTQNPQLQEPKTEDQAETNGYYKAAQSAYPASFEVEPAAPQSAENIIWSASEYVHYDKGWLWILSLVVLGSVTSALAFWLMGWSFTLLLVVMWISVGVFAFRPPRHLSYKMNNEGVLIENKFYNFKDFKSFSIMLGEGVHVILLAPTKRFMPFLNLYCTDDDSERIAEALSLHLPLQHIEPDLIDKFMRRLRF